MKKNSIVVILLLIIPMLSFGQSTIYLETFSGQVGKGASGSIPLVDLTDVTWNIDITNANVSNNYVFNVRTLNNGSTVFESRNVGTSIWLSPTINISSYSDITFTIDASQGRNQLDNDDTLTTEYRLDDGPWTVADTNGSLFNDYGNVTISQDNLNGNTLELRITSVNNANNERHRFNNIEVTGTADCYTTFSLPFNEGFEGGSFPPDCWQSYRGTNGLGTGFDWTSTTLTSNSGNTSAFVEYEAVTGGNAEDWLVTPAIELSNTQPQLRFFARDQFAINYNTSYSIRISETSQTDISSFTTIQTYTEATLGNAFNEKVIDLSEFTGIVYIAFVMEQNDGDNWFLDDISVEDISTCTTPEDVTNVTTVFENNSIRLDWQLSSCYDELLIIARENNPVSATPVGDGSTYMADTDFGSGTEISTDEFVVFKGVATGANISNVTLGSSYHFEIFTRKGSNWSAGVPFSYDSDYCTVTGDTAFFDTSITLVNFGSINNVTGQGSGYDDFTTQSTSITQGNSEDLTVQLNTDGDVTIYSYAWIDWNQDGDFDDAGETYDLGFAENTADGPTSNSALAITAPIDAELGDTRLRVLCQYYNTFIPNNGPCDGSTDGEIEDYTVTILPAITYTYDNGWSPEDPNGIATLANPIEIINGDVTFSLSTQAKHITVHPGAGITVNSGVLLTIADALELQSLSNAYASLILNGDISGTVRYKRHVNSYTNDGVLNDNDLISSPLSGQTFGDFANDNSNLLASNTLRAFAPFDKTTGTFTNYDTVSNNNTVITEGTAYRVATSDANTLNFTGAVKKNEVDVPIVSSGPQFDIWNLVGNPYTAYINVADFLNQEVSPGVANRDLLDPFAVAVYGWNGSGYDIINLFTAASINLAPGQGFFVATNGNHDLKFAPVMRKTSIEAGTSDDFIANANTNAVQFARLKLATTAKSYTTSFYFDDNTTIDLDPGYDTAVFGGNAPSDFALYSILVGENNMPFAIQAINTTHLSNVTIPLGVNANAGEQLTFSIEAMQLPSTINVYLEDQVTNTVTLLNTSDYILTPNTYLQGTGRFYVHFSNTTLSAPDQTLDSIQIQADNRNKNIVISGVLSTSSEVHIIDLHGRVITTQALDHTTTIQSINVNHINAGVYMVQVHNATGHKTVKVILK
ncbi:choice-of-anchor J domain-containing protein [Winogradskyella sp.]